VVVVVVATGDVGGNRGVQGGRKHPRVQVEGECSRWA